jgi:mannose-6-phosphate isomerase-like protein (cupin superfamily)
MAGGVGEVHLEHLLKPEMINEKTGLFAQVTIPVGSSLGYHEHHGESETYYILSGKGEYNDNGKTVEVGPGDVTFTPDGCGHGLVNTGDTDVVFIALIQKD